MKESKTLVFLVVILLIALIGTSGYIVYDKVLSNEEVKNECDKDTSTSQDNETTEPDEVKYTYNDVAGYYEFIEDVEPEAGSFTLELAKDGTFHYQHNLNAPVGTYGYYYIDGDKIYLNSIFEHGSSMGFTIPENIDVKEISIVSTDELLDLNTRVSQSGNTYTAITYKKISSDVQFGFIDAIKENVEYTR